MFSVLTHPLLGIIAGFLLGGLATACIHGPEAILIPALSILAGLVAVGGALIQALGAEIFPVGVNMLIRQTVIVCACFIASAMFNA